MALIKILFYFVVEHFYLFFRHASAFYVEVKEKVIEEFPFKDETLKTLSFVDPEKRDSSSLVIIIYVIILLSEK